MSNSCQHVWYSQVAHASRIMKRDHCVKCGAIRTARTALTAGP